MRSRRFLGACLCWIPLLLGIPLRQSLASGPLGPNGSRITTSRYGVDPSYNAVLAGTRATGLAGSYVAMGEGTDGNLQNAAGPAVRPAWSVDPLEYDASLTLLFPSALSGADFFNTGRGTTDVRRNDPSEFALLSPAATVQYGAWGVGFNGELQRYGLRRNQSLAPDTEEGLVRAQFSVLRWTIARAVDDGQLSAGIGLSVFALDLTKREEVLTRSGTLFTTRGVAFDSGLVWRPNALPFRLGLAVRAPVSTEVEAEGERSQSDIVLGSSGESTALWMPGSLRRSWTVHGGVAMHFGPRPLNLRWIDRRALLAVAEQEVEYRKACRARARHQELREAKKRGDEKKQQLDWEARERTSQARDLAWLEAQRERIRALLRARRDQLSRRYLLVTASLVAEGSLRDTVGIESFLSGIVDRVGGRVTWSPRVGLETEPIARWLKVRTGSYLEPARFSAARPRLHTTAGLDAKLFSWSALGLAEPDTEWSVGAAIDLASLYFSWGLSIGLWH